MLTSLTKTFSLAFEKVEVLQGQRRFHFYPSDVANALK